MAFIPVLTAPDKNDPGLIHYTKGGYSTAKIQDANTGSTMPNCVGWNYKRFCELNGKTKPDWRIPVTNPNEAISYAKSKGLKVSTNIDDFRLGAGIYWTGHEGMIEKINRNGDLTISQSHAKGTFFDTIVVKRSENYAYNGQKFLGYVFPDNDYGKGDFGKPETVAVEDYTKNTIPERFHVKDATTGKTLNTYTNYTYAKSYCDKVFGVIIDSTNGKQIYAAAKPVEVKKELTEKSYPDYNPNTNKYYYVMEEPKKWITSKGAFAYWRNAYKCWKANPGTHIYDCNWKKLD